MQYINVKVPATTALLGTTDDIMFLIETLVGHLVPLHDDVVYILNASTGHSPDRACEEGDICFVIDDSTYALAYDFVIDGHMARVFQYELTVTTVV